MTFIPIFYLGLSEYLLFLDCIIRLYFFGLGTVLNVVWQHGHLVPSHIMNISQTWHRF
jgi:hypothetical protein